MAAVVAAAKATKGGTKNVDTSFYFGSDKDEVAKLSSDDNNDGSDNNKLANEGGD